MAADSEVSILKRYSVTDRTVQFISRQHKMFVNGDWVTAISGQTRTIFEPSSGEPLATVCEANSADIDHAVKAAHTAFHSGAWPSMKPYDRQQLIFKLADLIEANADTFAELESIDNGKSVAMARAADVESVIRFFRYMAGWATKLEGTTKSLSVPGDTFAYTLRQPVGVVAGIVPWNFPFSMAAWKVAPALATGCTVVLKPAEITPLTALFLAEMSAEAGFPPGVINVVTGSGAEAGAALCSHPLVNKIAFTGSTPVGKQVGRAALENMTRVSLELGGKSPVIVLDDADIELAARGAADAIFFNQGQVCCAGSRLYAHKNIYEKLLDRVVNIAEQMKLAPGLDPECEMGPLVSDKQLKTVCSYIDLAEQEGAERVTGGRLENSEGYFVKPTVFSNTSNQMRIVREEIFGPVLCAQPFSSIDDVITKANDSAYGLGASIWSNKLSTVHQMVPKIESGTVWINTHNPVDACLPFGGVKQSGYGREQGHEQLESFLETKSVWMNL